MPNFEVPPTDNTPYVLFDLDRALIEIKGRSFPSDPRDFYYQIFKWWDIFSKQPGNENKIVLEIDYFDSASVGYLLKLLRLINQAETSENKFLVEWIYESGDVDMKHLAEGISELMTVRFEIKEKIVAK